MVNKITFAEANDQELSYAGKDFYDRELYLELNTLDALKRMVSMANADNVELYIVSGFRSYQYQQSIIDRKLAEGQSLEQIIKVSALPGQSEHHTGRAIDFTTKNETIVLTENFEKTKAFEWLTNNANKFGFFMSFPRNNKYGFIYEPWHWCYKGG